MRSKQYYELTLCEIIKNNLEEEFISFEKSVNESYKNSLFKRLSGTLNEQVDILKKIEDNELTNNELIHYGNVTLEDLSYELVEIEQCNTSEVFFPGHVLLLYPLINEVRAKKEITCNFSGAVIKKGSLYIVYKPFIEDLTDGKVYVLSHNIKCEIYFKDRLPCNIKELETLHIKMCNSYCLNDDEIYNLTTNYGSDGISFIKLGKKRRKNEGANK